MFNFIRKSFMMKMVISFVLVALVPTALVGYLGFSRARSALNDFVNLTLESDREQSRNHLREYLATSMINLRFLADTGPVRTVFDVLAFYKDNKTPGAKGFQFGQDEYQRIVRQSVPVFEKWLDLYGPANAYKDVLIVIGDKDGYVFYTQKKLADVGCELSATDLKDSQLAKAWENVAKTQKPAMTDFGWYKPAGEVSAFMGTPIFVENKFCGMLAVRFGPEAIDTLLKGVGRGGKTKDTFILGQELLMRSNARFAEAGILKQKVEGKAATEALEGKSGIGMITDYRGAQVLGSWASIGISSMKDLGADFDWGLISQVDADEAFAAVSTLGYHVVLISAAICVFVSIIAFLMAGTTARPIMALAAKVGNISRGDLTVEVGLQSRMDELGVLAQALRAMLENLRNQTRQILDGARVLNNSAMEISSTVAELAASAQRVATAVQEATATTEQIRQAADVSSQKAKKVAQDSEQSVQISRSGRQATQDTMLSISRIREQMTSIGETVVKLSDHTKDIEQIMGWVQDLADQSNLLAVNASIEAARAGDQGKGFAVVANEIKTLADQSRQAVGQVRTILGDTQKWAGAVVMAVEAGTKGVEEGVAQSSLAGDSIQVLTGSVEASYEAATVIETSSEQQSVGMEQLALAMSNIDQATGQNMTGITQLDSAAKNLEDLSGSLKKLIERYEL